MNPLKMLMQYHGLSRRPFWSPDRIQAYQIERIRKILAAARETPLYQGKNLPAPEDFSSLDQITKLPILTKEDLLNSAPEQRISAQHSLSDLVVSRSSGSTGQALDVFYDVSSYGFFIMAMVRLYRMAFAYQPWHKQTYIYTTPYPVSSLFGLYPVQFISTLTPIQETISLLRKNPPDFLVCYPSHLRAIAEKMTEEDFKVIRPKAINVNSEMSAAAEREHLGRLFDCFVFDDYSSEELTRIASQCRHKSYHLFEDINFIEIVDDEGAPLPEGVVGNILGTNLHNVGMPLIRYKQGDRGSIRTKKCSCGRTMRTLETLEGRKNDAFLLPDGEKLSSGYLLDLSYQVFLQYPGSAASFCLVQERVEAWTLELVPGKNWRPEHSGAIKMHLEHLLNRPSIQISIELVEDVRKTKSGKANPIISRISGD